MLILSYLAFLSPAFALAAAIFLYRQHCLARPRHRIPALVYAAIIFICAAAGYFFGMIFGVDYACSPPAYNLCGLAGVFIIGPLVSAFAILLIGSLILLLPRDKANSS
jgi:CDP-diglyceride synthetase